MVQRHVTSLVVACAMAIGASAQLHAQATATPIPSKTVRSPAPGTMWLYAERIPLQDGGYVNVERGIYFASANRMKPNANVIGVEVYRFRRSSKAPAAAPPIFFLPGGPTFQGLESSLRNAGYYEREIAPWLDASDYIVVGQRGIGSSKPNTLCEATGRAPADATDAQLLALEQAAHRRCQAFWRESGVDLEGLTVIQAVADLDEIRTALGYDKIQIWGGSFGSHWGMAYMRFHPENVVRVVLRGLEGPDNTYDHPHGLAKALERIAAAADTSAALKGMIPPGGLFKAFQDVVARVEKQPVMVTLTDSTTKQTRVVRIDADAVRALAMTSARNWPAMVIALHRGDYTAAARIASRRGAPSGIQTASYYMLDCGSGISKERDAAMLADPAVRLIGERNADYRAACPVWNSDNGDAFRTYFDTNIPTVFVQGDWDTSTPIENAYELAPHFKNLHFVLVKGGSHGSLAEAVNASDAFRREMVEWFATGDTVNLPKEVALPPVKWLVPTQSGR
jgi:pimeloyl-ACP methyl ester carboxylesterase